MDDEKQAATPHYLNDEERDAILAALRYWQKHGAPDFEDIASNAGAHDVLTDGEIDQLCEDLNS